MKVKLFRRTLAVLVLAACLALALAAPALAFESRSGDIVTIGAGEVIEDDLYVGANTVILEGTVRGDLIAAGATIRIESSGVVEGDLLAAGQSVIVNGRVQDDARIAGAALTLGEGGEVADDVIAAGYSLETGSGSTIGGDLVYGGAQALLAGTIAGEVLAGAEGLEIRGAIEGNVDAEVGSGEDPATYSPFMFMPNAPDVPDVPGGLTVAESARIGGNLEYTSRTEFTIPAAVVAGQVVREQPPLGERPAAAAAGPLDWFLDFLRTLATLLLAGLLMVWLAPNFTRAAADTLQARPLASLGWGIASIFLVFLALFVLAVIVAILALLFGVVTLSDLMGATIWTGVFTAFTLILGFGLAVGYVSKIVASYLAGRWLLARLQPGWAESRVWPLVVGVLVFAILDAIPILGGIVSFIVILFGLGAIWLVIWRWFQARPRLVFAEPAPGD